MACILFAPIPANANVEYTSFASVSGISRLAKAPASATRTNSSMTNTFYNLGKELHPVKPSVQSVYDLCNVSVGSAHNIEAQDVPDHRTVDQAPGGQGLYCTC